jgi:hypothetical protein
MAPTEQLTGRALACLCATLLATACAPRAHSPGPGRPASAADVDTTTVHANEVRAPTAEDRSRALAEHAEALQAEHGADGFTFVVEPPFVVGGDESPATVRRRATGTVGWAVRMLKDGYFEKDPEHLIVVWLFKDKTSYRRHCKELWAQDPDTPYGYYSPTDRVLAMNIASGGGTLVHEIVHPFMEANFPDCPAWFNEGLASLYEQSTEVDGRIHGLPNWRLAGLKKRIEARTLPTFAELTSLSDSAFYRSSHGYAQARYLCYDLQQQGLLREYYRRFVANHEKDPTGYDTLLAILGEPDMADWEMGWRRRTTALRFPE